MKLVAGLPTPGSLRPTGLLYQKRRGVIGV